MLFKPRNVLDNNHVAVRYDHYRFSSKEFIMSLLGGITIDAVISYLFFNSFLVAVVLLPILVGWMKYVKTILAKKRILRLNIEFKDGISAVVSALHAGYSVENAFKSAWRELCVLYGEGSDIAAEFKRIANCADINKSIDAVLMDLGERSGIQDIKSFAEVFVIARKSGGHLIQTVTNTIGTISGRIQVKEEIDSIMSAKRYEQNIMMAVPLFILLYLRIAASSFLDVLYTTIIGRIIMAACLVVYIAAFFLGNRICDIEINQGGM